mgnify:CR=1
EFLSAVGKTIASHDPHFYWEPKRTVQVPYFLGELRDCLGSKKKEKKGRKIGEGASFLLY